MDRKEYNKKRVESSRADEKQLTKRQVHRLANLTGVSADELRNRNIAEISETMKWRIDPALLSFRRICGQVVKTDPNTGLDRPVPFATVYVEDTDCSFLGLFPVEGPWAWLFPVSCHREDLASVHADECGRFCVWIPWFEIDWILRWRRERFCYGDFFVKPSIREFLERVGVPPIPPEDGIRPHVGPGPDPAPFILKDGGMTLQRVEAVLGRDTALKLGAAESAAGFGSQNSAFRELLEKPAFPSPVPPPIPPRLHDIHSQEGIKGVAALLNVSAERITDLRFDHYIGPFLRCVDMYVPEFVPIYDVPDITFRVTQDVDMDGNEEVIYSEGFFDVRWNAGAIPDVTLHASAIALSTSACGVPTVDCAVPEIKFAGVMPLDANYLDAATGYATRPNRPHPHGFLTEAPTPGNSAIAPFMGTLQLFGCNQHAGAKYYRLHYSYNGAAPVPFTNVSWWVFPWGGGANKHMVPDAQGWYEILDPPEAWFPAHELLDWSTSTPGSYVVHMELGDMGKNHLVDSPPVAFRVDNSSPSPQFTSLAWRVAGAAGWTYFPGFGCSVVRRPTGSDIELRVSYMVSATHLLKTTLWGSGCGPQSPRPERKTAPDWSDPPTNAVDVSGNSLNPYEHWHRNQFDNNVARTAIFSLPGTAPEGAYGFNLWAYSRAFNPDGGDASDPQANDWYVNTAWLIWNYTFLPVAVVNL